MTDYDVCDRCGRELTPDVDAVVDYGVCMCQDCLNKCPEARRHLYYVFATDPVETDHQE
ncbi:MAG: hypothetical protein ACYS21_20455 [Planctomycetota bacterium]|jgi:hypothetical protein